jgi:hypothetical protein|tara:strand:- start:299 stop:622 length:324 start_codon:yes stop_codon:yes gene_type:complete
MPEVRDKTTEKVVAKFDYDAGGEAEAEKLANTDINLEVVDAPMGVYNAPDMRDSYQLGGKIPGQQGFGERPIASPLGQKPIIKSPLSPIMEGGGEIPKYKKGGKAKK